jgi:hypothetical protein
MEVVYTLLSGKKLDKNAFLSYLSDKIRKTAKKFQITKPSKQVYCLDDAAIEIIYGLMSDKTAKIRKSEFLHCLKKELEIYAGIKGKKFSFIEYKGLRLKIKQMLDNLEKQHPEIKYSIFNSVSALSGS